MGDASFRTGTKEPKPVDTLAFGAYRRSVFDRVGVFDEELVRNQDDELNARLVQAGGTIWLDPDIRSIYHSRATIRGLWRQYWQYGLYKVRVIQKRGGVQTLRQLVPPMFVLTLASGGAVWVVVGSKLPLAVTAGAYTIANLGAAIWVGRDTLELVPSVSLAFAAMHVGYGCGFVGGLWRWRQYWRRPHDVLETGGSSGE